MENIYDHITHYSEIKPNSTFIKYMNEELTYRQTWEKVNSVAYNLRKLGITSNQAVGILLPNVPEFITSYFGILRNNCIAVLLPTTSSSQELATFIKKSHIQTLIYSDKFKKQVDETESISGNLLKKIVLGLPNENEIILSNLLKSNSHLQNDYKVGSKEQAVIIFTSGTTGIPKGVILSHENILSNALSCCEIFRSEKDTRISGFFPLYNCFSHTLVMNTALILGGTIVLTNKYNPEEITKLIRKEKISIFVSNPDLLCKIAELSDLKENDLSSLNLCISIGYSLQQPFIEKWEEKYNSIILEGYGLTEASSIVTINRSIEDRKIGSIGLALSCNQARIIDNNGARASIGHTGELQIRGKNVMLGYLGEYSNDGYNENVWFSTGDLVKQDIDGYFYFEGRKSDLIYRYGYYINPKSIERIIIKHSKVEEVIALGLDINNLNQNIKVCIVPKDKKNLTQEEIFKYCKEKLPKYLQPEIVEFYDNIPRNSLGKVVRNLLN